MEYRTKEMIIKELEQEEENITKDLDVVYNKYFDKNKMGSYGTYLIDTKLGEQKALRKVITLLKNTEIVEETKPLEGVPYDFEEKCPVPDRFWEFSPGVVLDAKRIDFIWKQWGALYVLMGGVEKCLLAKSAELEEKYTLLINWWKYWNV